MIDLLIAVPMVMAIVEILKRTGLIRSRFAPLTSLVMGVALFYFFCTGVLLDCLLEGLLTGLTASGLYSGAKATVAK